MLIAGATFWALFHYKVGIIPLIGARTREHQHEEAGDAQAPP